MDDTEKRCATCVHMRKTWSEVPCSICRDGDRWEGKTCGKCKHCDENAYADPCHDCKGWKEDSDKLYWEPKEENNKEPKKVYITTGWDRHNQLFDTDTDVASMYPKFTYKHGADMEDAIRYAAADIKLTKELLNGKYGLSSRNHIPEIRDVKFNNPATIVFWADGTKTVVRCQNGEEYDPEKGLAMAISKKALGNTREYYHTFLHELKKVDKNSESKKMIECDDAVAKSIEAALIDAGLLHHNRLSEK